MKLRSILTNVWLLSLIPFIIVAIFAPINISRYNLILLRTDIVTTGHYIFYDDLDDDGISERIVAFDQFGSSGLSISNREGIIEQWNFRGSFDFGIKSNILLTGDKDNNGKKEIYTFTISHDSILLHSIENLTSPVPSISNRFIAIAGKGIKKPDPFIIQAEMEDLNGDGIRELIFGIGAGFSKYPRRIFSYNITKDVLTGSPETSYYFQGIKQADLNGDGIREIIPWGYAAGNVGPDQAKYNDYSSYLFALGKNMKFVFNPIEFPGKYSHVTPLFRTIEGVRRMAGLYSSSSTSSFSTIFTIDSDGKVTDSLSLDFYSPLVECIDDQYLFPVSQKDLVLYDKNFKKIKSLPFSTGSYLIKDIDYDGQNEYIFHNLAENKLYVFRKGLSYPASIKVTISTNGWDTFTLRKGYEPDPSISVQTGQNHYIISYRKNRTYIYSYLFYPGIYFSILAFALLIRTIQRSQLRKRYENEKKISELQMALIRNQLDPHFTLNALNSIIYSVNYGDRDIAAESLRCFAGMYRDMVLSAGSSRRTIEDEVEFCRNYLSLEKMRYGARFDYTLEIAETVDLKALIPKFLIQIHSENAIKHGLSPLESGGLLKIKLTSDENELVIEVTDNGVGREYAMQEQGNSTKKGLEVMNELYSLYYKFYNEKIVSEITDLHDKEGKAAGTSVIIRIIRQSDTVKAN